MTQSQDDALARAARLLAGALNELQAAATDNTALRDELTRQRASIDALGQRLEKELAADRSAIESLTQKLEGQLVDDREQRRQMAGQLTNLAGSLDRLVSHLEGLSHLMADILERLAAPPGEPPAPAQPATPPEPIFQPGGEGVSLTIAGVPGFQALMDIQKALSSIEAVSGASVERFQEGDSRVQLQLRGPITSTEIAGVLGSQTGHAFAIEEARPELMRLRLKIVS